MFTEAIRLGRSASQDTLSAGRRARSSAHAQQTGVKTKARRRLRYRHAMVFSSTGQWILGLSAFARSPPARHPLRLAQPKIKASRRNRGHAHFHLHFASDVARVSHVPGKPKSKHRSGCPVSISLEMFGDRWSLLIIRDLMVRGFRTFKQFQESGEGIATNILADRLRKLQATGI